MSSSSDRDRLVSHPHQSLWKHLTSVDEVSRRALAGKQFGLTLFPDVAVDDLRRVLVWFHDYGKSTDFFQYRIARAAAKSNPNFENLDAAHVLKSLRTDDPEVVRVANEVGNALRGHSTIGAFAAQKALPEHTSPLLRAIVWEAIARHHGNLKNFDGDVFRGSEDHAKTLAGQWARLYHDEYRAILKEVGLPAPGGLSELMRACPKMFFGKIYHFELRNNKSLRPYLQTVFLFSLLLSGDKGDMMLRDRSVIGRVRRMPRTLIAQYKTAKFSGSRPTQLNEWREDAYEKVAINLNNNPDAGCYSITLPTGMGKTLTAYNTAVQLQNLLAKRYGSNNEYCAARIIYCLPFTSVIDQNAVILEDILDVAQEDLSGELAKHHYMADWPDAVAGQSEELKYSEKEYLVEGWEYSLTVTTFVQLLHTIISNRNRQLRKFHNLANAIIVLDEVQSIPPKYFDLVSRLFVALYEQLGTRFIFVTATQPFLMNPDDKMTPVELTDPSRIYTRQVFERMNRIDLDVTLWQNGPDDINELTDVFAAAIRSETDKSFLIILNLIAESQQVFGALSEVKEAGVTYLYLSSAILPVCRKRIIRRIKNRKRLPGRVVVVSTQVVEAGVDIDLDVVYRAFAPLDSINQSAGRCNRNMDTDKRGSVRLFRNDGAKKIYDRVLLERTESTLIYQLKKLAEAGHAPGIVPEASFYALNEQYARAIRSAVAETTGDSADILRNLHRLQFESANDTFALIPHIFESYGVFIDDPDELPTVRHKTAEGEVELNSQQVYRRMIAILHDDGLDRWTKKEQLRLLRPALLQYVVQFKEKYLIDDPDLLDEAKRKPFIRLGLESGPRDYTLRYNLTTGYFKPEEKPTKSF